MGAPQKQYIRASRSEVVKTEPEIKSIIRNYAPRLEKAGIEVEKFILDGSYARDSPNEYSDFDVAVISSKFEDMDTLEKQLMLSKASKWGLNAGIEPLGLSCH